MTEGRKVRYGDELIYDAEFTRKFIAWIEPIARTYFSRRGTWCRAFAAQTDAAGKSP